MSKKLKRTSQPAVRCAVYTRKSTSEGLDQEFNSLDAQREAAEAYIASQQGVGWVCLPDGYDDGGFSGANIDRPALTRLLVDIEAGKVDTVVVYKVDRLSRSLLDFARMLETFERFKVSFVSVTQHFNTATSMGRLILNVLLSFAQFEREMISERTRDKMAAARRKGKWLGGRPVLGYDVDARTRRLVVNPEAAARVRAIFQLYLQLGGLIPTVVELSRRGWRTKRWTTRKGLVCGGKAYGKGTLHCLLTNVTYRGKVKYQDEVFDGEHEAIVPADMFQRVQALLEQNRRKRRRRRTQRCPGLLDGLLYCAACQSQMIHTYTTKGPCRYRYYVCSHAQKRGWDSCPSKSIPAMEIERFVVNEVQQASARDPACREVRCDRVSTPEQAQWLARRVDRVEYDGRQGDLHIKMHPGGSKESA